MTEAVFKLRAAIPGSGEVGLFPVDDEGKELIGKIKTGRDVTCDVKQRRNPDHHRLFFAIIRFIQYHSTMFSDVPIAHIKDAVKVATNCGSTYFNTQTGERVFVPRSISFASMDQTEFNAFFDDACKVIAGRWMPPGTTAESVRAELLKMIDGPNARGSKVA